MNIVRLSRPRKKGVTIVWAKKGVCRIAADIPIKLKILIYSFV